VTSDDDNVGYKRPPKHTRFKPGQSGNKRGLHKPVPTLKTDLIEELNEVIRVREGGHEKKITKQRAIIKALVAAALQGNIRAATALVALCDRAFGNERQADQSPAAPDDLEILAEYVGREVTRHAARVGAADDSQHQPRERTLTDDK
jgi:hypothetical protein